MTSSSYVYILASQRNGSLYIGVTGNLGQRVWQHKNHEVAGFSQKYCIEQLVYYEIFDDIEGAIKREKQLKKWNRDWKLELIEQMNPDWKDLFEDICM